MIITTEEYNKLKKNSDKWEELEKYVKHLLYDDDDGFDNDSLLELGEHIAMKFDMI
jgi:hypothetical protein